MASQGGWFRGRGLNMSKPLITKLCEGESVSLRVAMSWTVTGEILVRCNCFILFFGGLFSPFWYGRLIFQFHSFANKAP